LLALIALSIVLRDRGHHRTLHRTRRQRD